jgi:alcohol dehydrogenase class IV
MDGVTQLMESSISGKRRPETIQLALAGLEVVREGLIRCHTRPDDLEGRARVAFASSLSGICLANSGLGLVHGIASGLGGHRKIPHGLICAVLLPHALEYNREAVAAELRASLSAFLGGKETDSTIDDGIAAIQALNTTLATPPDLRFVGLSEPEIEEVARDSMGSSMSGNPVPMTVQTVVEFLKKVC